MENIYRRGKAYIFFITLIASVQWKPLAGQICVDDYFFENFSTATVQLPVASLPTSQNEIIMAGNAQRNNSLLQGGWLTKFSAQGTILWSKLFYTNLLNYTNFTGIVPADGDNFIITGNVGDVDTNSRLTPLPHLNEAGLVLKVDKYGNIIWCKKVTSLVSIFAFTDITDISKTSDGGFIMALTSFYITDYRAVVRMDANGNVKWTTLINSYSRTSFFGNSRVKVLDNGQVFFNTYANVQDTDYAYQRQGYLLASLDASTGEKIWSHFFLPKDTLSYYQSEFGEIVDVTQLPDRSLSFITSYAYQRVNSYFRKTDQVLNFMTDSFGVLRKVISYTSPFTPLTASSVAKYKNDGRTVLMDNGDRSFMMSVDADGNVLWKKGYAQTGRGQETRTVFNTNFGSYFFSLTHNGGSKDPKLIKTDSVGNAPCIESDFNISAKDTTSSFFMQNLHLNYLKSGSAWDDFQLGVFPYYIKGTNVCRIACCEDVTDTAAEVSLCNIPAYTLPNNDVVKNSGIYTITYKTTKGCDSIVYYKVNLNFAPKVNLGGDTCFSRRDTLTLKAEPGYDSYTWNGILTNSPTYGVNKPGDYTVSVTNSCGTKSDTLKIFETCEFEIFMPNAFTPNGDGLNDVFRIPKDNYNLLVSFTIYNRWGQRIFQTANISEGWNGMNREYPAAIGTYIYVVVMKSLDGRKTFSKKGYVSLIR